MINSDNIPDNLKDMLNNIKDSKNTSDNSSNNISKESISSIVSMLSSSTSKNNSDSESNIDMDTILKMKTIIDAINSNKNDPRANLLYSLKPYLKESRQEKIDQYVKLFNMSKVIDVFNKNGGDN